MNLSPDDPKLTAYALGELPANEAKEVELALQNSPELRAAVEAIRQTAELLKNEFIAEPAPALSSNEKDAVIATIQPHNVVPLPNRRFWRTAGLSAIAASILCIVAWQMSLRDKQPFSVAQTESAQALSPAVEAKPANPAPTAAVPSELSKEEAFGVKSRVVTDTANPADKQLAGTSVQAEPPVLNGKVEQERAAGGKKDVERLDLSVRSEQPVALPAEAQSDRLAKTFARQQRKPQVVTPSAPAQPMPETAATASVQTGQSATIVAYSSGGQAESLSYGVAENGFVAGSTPTARTRTLAAGDATYNYGRLNDSRYVFSETQDKWYWNKEQPEQRKLHHLYSEGDFKRSRHFDDGDTARYPKYKENDFESVLENPLSTFSIDVDTASYANVRRFLNEDRLPPKDAVRIEEMINYFSYDYPQPKGDEPFSVNMEVANCPWQPEHRLLRVGLKGKEMAQNKRPPSNFVFLMDVSGSMSPQERLPLVKQALRMLVKRMTENDRIAIVVYASSSGVVLESTSAVNKEKILEALERLEAGGSTNGGQGIQRAYALAEEHFIKGGVNRVILCTDGDFNVGITNQDELIKLIERKAKSGVFLSVLGVGTDNYKDALMQKLADKGNGNYHYLDSVEEAHKVLVQQMNGTLVTIAKDVKIQIEFNPAQVSSYRLIGYEKRILAAEDFNNDKKDAGEIGAGHTVTALYEIVPAGSERTRTVAAVDDLKYQRKVAAPKPSRETIGGNKEMLTLKLRFKKPDADKSVLREHTLVDQEKKLSQASTDFRFAASVASFGMVLKDSEHKGRANFGSVLELARESKGDDKEGYRAEFINLVKKARELQRD